MIQISLQAAVDFVMALKTRGTAAFGPQPDPIASAAAQRTAVLRYSGGEKDLTESTSRRLVIDDMIARRGDY